MPDRLNQEDANFYGFDKIITKNTLQAIQLLIGKYTLSCSCAQKFQPFC